jgi:hypothetical protein
MEAFRPSQRARIMYNILILAYYGVLSGEHRGDYH